MVAATLLAALAAVASAYAAFRLERASFTVQLFSKQVDAVAELNDLEGNFTLNSEGRVLSRFPSQPRDDMPLTIEKKVDERGSVLIDPADIEMVNRRAKDIVDRDEKMIIAFARLQLISPSSIALIARALQSDIYNYDEYILGEARFVTEQGVFDAQCSNMSDKTQCAVETFELTSSARRDIDADFVRGFNQIDYCVYEQLSRGNMLTESFEHDCLLKKRS